MKPIEECSFFNENWNTLKELSKDDSNRANVIFMTESSLNAVDFDAVKRCYANNIGLSEECACSLDALFLPPQKRLVFIEFKNGKLKGTYHELGNKIRDSLLIFCDISACGISETRKKAEFVLVYNIGKNQRKKEEKVCVVKREETERDTEEDESPSLDALMKEVAKLAKEEIVRFGLERFEGLYFRKVHTYSSEEFEKYLHTFHDC